MIDRTTTPTNLDVWSCDPRSIPVYTPEENRERFLKMRAVLADIFGWDNPPLEDNQPASTTES